MADEVSISAIKSMTQTIELASYEIEKNINTAQYCHFLILRKENEEEAKQKYPEFEEYYQKYGQISDQPQDLRSVRIKDEDTLKILCPRLADQYDQAYQQLNSNVFDDEAQEVVRDEMFNMGQKIKTGTFGRADIGSMLRNVIGTAFKGDDEKLTKFESILTEIEAKQK
jgi:hypothetical protein